MYSLISFKYCWYSSAKSCICCSINCGASFVGSITFVSGLKASPNCKNKSSFDLYVGLTTNTSSITPASTYRLINDVVETLKKFGIHDKTSLIPLKDVTAEGSKEIQGVYKKLFRDRCKDSFDLTKPYEVTKFIVKIYRKLFGSKISYFIRFS